MKKLLKLLLLTAALWSCNNYNASEQKQTISEQEAGHHEHTIANNGLVLNNGAKWKADSSTNGNVKSLLNRIETFNNVSDTSLPAYIVVSADLQQGLNKMISDCKMQGEDHEALHKWLQPVIEQVGKLKQVSATVEAAAIFEAIHEQVILYTKYFE